MNRDELLKTIIDTFGSLSFLLETAVKLHQTGDHSEIKERCFDVAQNVANKLYTQLESLNTQPNE